jgi:hypothetical protein
MSPFDALAFARDSLVERTNYSTFKKNYSMVALAATLSID